MEPTQYEDNEDVPRTPNIYRYRFHHLLKSKMAARDTKCNPLVGLYSRDLESNRDVYSIWRVQYW